MLSKLSSLILRLLGWRIEGVLPDAPKYVLIVAPHTSNWDFPLGLLTRNALRLGGSFLGKAELFRPPFGWFFRWLGGYPVDRSHSTNLVEASAALIRQHEHFILVLAPEGTRKYTPAWKTGFYYIARAAGVPILMVQFDYEHRCVRIGKLFYPGDNAEQDLAAIYDYYRGVKGKYPEKGTFSMMG